MKATSQLAVLANPFCCSTWGLEIPLSAVPMLSKAEPFFILRVEESHSLGRDGEAYFTTVIHNYLLMLKLMKEILNFGIHGNIHGHRNVKPDPSAQSPAILFTLFTSFLVLSQASLFLPTPTQLSRDFSPIP